MMKTKVLGVLVSSLAMITGSAFAQSNLVNDSFTAANVGSGFALNNGINSGINPPTATRLTGNLAGSLRYLKRGAKNDTAYTIASGRANMTKGAQSGRFTISADGSNPYDFGPILGCLGASTGNPAVYDVAITMSTGDGTGRLGFGLGTAESAAGGWNFGFQIVKSVTAYGIYKRIDTAATGFGAELNSLITTAGTAGSNLSFLMHVTDSGTETNTFTSRVQLSIDGGATWIYDSQTDTDLTSGWRFEIGSRFLSFDQEINSTGPDNYDNFSVTWISGPPPTNPTARVWTGAGTDANWSTASNWQGGIIPGTGEAIGFSGTTQQVNTNDLVGLTSSSLTFSNGGFALYGNVWTNTTGLGSSGGINTIFNDLVWSTGSGKNWTITNNSELVLSNTTTVEVGGDHIFAGGGTLRVKGTMNIGVATTANPAFVLNEGQHIVDGGSFTSRGGYRIGSLGTATAGTQTIVTNGGTFTLTVSGANLRVGDSSNSVTSRLIVDHSTLSMAGASIGIPYAAGATSEVWQTGGRVAGAIINFNQNGAGRGTYGVTNGTLEAIQIKKNTSGGTSRIYFDNAVLRTGIGASNNAFFSGLNSAEIETTGLTIDAVSDVTIDQVLRGAGGLVKSNSSAVTLTAANTYTGNTFVQAGRLSFTTVTNATAVQVGDNAELGVLVKSPGTTLSIPSLSFLGSSLGILSFDLSTFATPTAPLLSVNGLSVNGHVSIRIANGVQLTTGTITLVTYSNSITGGFQFTLDSLPPGVSATLVNNTANGSIDLNITSVPAFRWIGSVSGDWDSSTQNWIDERTGLPSTFTDGFPAEFMDDASNTVVNIPGFPNPSVIALSNNVLNYVWGGGALTTPLIRKNGTGSITRIENGADFVNSLELNQGSFIVSNAIPSTLSTVLTDNGVGTGTFVKDGPATMTITSTNSSYDGTIVIKQGLIKITADRALGATTGVTVISNGATLDLNDFVPGAEPVKVSGAGTTGQGAIIDSTTGTAVDTNLRDVTMTGDTTFGVPNGGRWDLRIRSGVGVAPGLQGNGFNLTKVGSGTVSIACQRNLGASTPYWHMNLGDIFIQQGSLAFAESLSLDNPAKSIFIWPGASIQFYDLNVTNPVLRNIYVTNATLNCGGGNTDTNVINGSIQLNGAVSIKPDQGIYAINGAITGPGSLSMSANDPGRVFLNGINTFSGDLTVTNGTLGGSGSIAGNLVMLGGTNAPGGFTAVGTFTVNGNATLAGTTLMELNRSLSPNSDRLVVGGTLTSGGILTVTVAPGAPAPQSGDVYQLFNKPAGSFSAIHLPTLAAGLSWSTSNLGVNGSISVTGTATRPSISSVSASGGNLVLSGTGGVQGNSYVVISSTNVAAQLSSWIPVATNTFGPGGTFSFTNAINPAVPATFFGLQLQ